MSADLSGQNRWPLIAEQVGSAPPLAGAGSNPAAQILGKRWSVYAWSLVREGSGASALAPGAQYGGSQAGLIVRYALGDTGRAPAVYARAASALANDDDRTLALGVTARPWRALPVDLAVERRFSLGTPQNDRFAALLVGGGSTSLGRSRIRLDAFGQTGIVGYRDAQGFFDAQMLVSRQVAAQDGYSVSLGGGVWAGGQQEPDAAGSKRWVHRVDLGPRVTLVLPVGDSQMTVALDWRQRVDGDALPASGVALTVSTGF
ncbi:hypothetical protein GCM10010833_03490 [Blastomonas aquatica]|uniref:Haemolysin activator HlyB C-terminal domain-containing protein n=1 Tax=Blastomonas aquatica TaxID=1510276 RepID=A0ABQ1ITZ5_9SPHN|nr:hypothetical protein GCM10010833_03490 [Blastomonas aquatica]